MILMSVQGLKEMIVQNRQHSVFISFYLEVGEYNLHNNERDICVIHSSLLQIELQCCFRFRLCYHRLPDRVVLPDKADILLNFFKINLFNFFKSLFIVLA